jgi:hypothetical protein
MRNPGNQEELFPGFLSSWFPYRPFGFRVFRPACGTFRGLKQSVVRSLIDPVKMPGKLPPQEN